jgi:hypothetical protein
MQLYTAGRLRIEANRKTLGFVACELSEEPVPRCIGKPKFVRSCQFAE